jgi:hypothetical protein
MFKVTISTQQQCINVGTVFIVATCFSLIRPSSGQHSEISDISAYYVLWEVCNGNEGCC